MASVAELLDPDNPKVGPAFVKKLKIFLGNAVSLRLSERSDSCAGKLGWSDGETKLEGPPGRAARSIVWKRIWFVCQASVSCRGVISFLEIPGDRGGDGRLPVGASHKVQCVRHTKLSVSEPFLVSVTFPTVLLRGHTGEVFRETSLMARFMPGQGLLPQQGKFPFLCGRKQRLSAAWPRVGIGFRKKLLVPCPAIRWLVWLRVRVLALLKVYASR